MRRRGYGRRRSNQHEVHGRHRRFRVAEEPNRSARGAKALTVRAVLLVWALPGISVLALGCSGTVQPTTPPDFQALIRQLAAPQTAWEAESRLQKLGAPAAAALVAHLRQDGFRDRDHGNHSQTMRALEKIGDPAVAEVERELTPALLGSTDPWDVQHVETAILVLTAIGGSTAAPVLIRVAAGCRRGWQRFERAPRGRFTGVRQDRLAQRREPAVVKERRFVGSAPQPLGEEPAVAVANFVDHCAWFMSRGSRSRAARRCRGA